MTDSEFLNNLVWAEKYRPDTLEDAILPESTKNLVADSIKNGSIPHFLFTGTAGTGKTTLARIITKLLDADLLFINASLDNGIDSIRMRVTQFSSSVSLSGGVKFVLLDEADGLTAAGQQGIRGVIEEFTNTRFIFTCNFKNKIIEAIHSRCVVVDFKVSKEESPKLQSKFFKRMCQILDTENIEYEKPVVAELVKKFYPDFRRTINELQRYSASGKIDSGILINTTELAYKELIGHLKNKNFTEMRKWVGANADIDSTTLFRSLYDMSSNLLTPKCLPSVIITLADYLYKSTMVADQQIIIAAALTELMLQGEWL